LKVLPDGQAAGHSFVGAILTSSVIFDAASVRYASNEI